MVALGYIGEGLRVPLFPILGFRDPLHVDGSGVRRGWRVGQFAAALQQQAKLLDLSPRAHLGLGAGWRDQLLERRVQRASTATPPTEAIGRRSHELLATVCLASDPDFEAAVARDGRWMGELAHTTRDGLRVIVESLQELLPQPRGRRPLVLETNRDVTARKEAERQLREAKEVAERANAAKSRFLAAASHDLRQPLQAIDLQRAILARIATEPAAVRAIANLGSSIDTMRNALDSLLDLSQLETGAIQAEPVEFALNDLLQVITREFDGLASSKGLQLRAPTTTALVRTDRRLLERVLQNLVANAIKYTGRRQGLDRLPANAASRFHSGLGHWDRDRGRQARADLR